MNDAPDEAIARVQTQAFSGYDGRRIALLAQHGKERVIAPVLERALGCRVEVARGFDTDRLDTFTRDVPRAGASLANVRRESGFNAVYVLQGYPSVRFVAPTFLIHGHEEKDL